MQLRSCYPIEQHLRGAPKDAYQKCMMERQPNTADLQISTDGQTTSLGDYATQEAAAAAFDRAAINRDGATAATNFDVVDYASEMHVWESEPGL
jgi:hypothetical protein